MVFWLDILIIMDNLLFHNKTYQLGVLSSYSWQDIQGRELKLTIDEGSFKWVIELFQGVGKIRTIGASDIISYDELSYDWYDMTLTTGTILGSTNKRIQIANDEFELPNGTPTEALVLQGRYVQLLTSGDVPSFSTRGYVQSYDTTFGHVYPKADSFGIENINLADKVAFYKNTNDPEYILATDKVVAASNEGENVRGLFDGVTTDPVDSFCLNQNDILMVSGGFRIKLDDNCKLKYEANVTGDISITNKPSLLLIYKPTGGYAIVLTSAIGPLYEEDGSYWYVDATYYSGYAFDSTSYYKVTEGSDNGKIWHDSSWWRGADEPTGLITLGGVKLQEGDYVLLKDQTDPRENGVYIAHDRGADATGTPNTGRVRWQRAGSWDVWSDYIGKIIYVSSGTNGGKNFESLATAGGKLYYAENLASNMANTTPLIFKEEKPILLYPNKLTATVNIAADVLVEGAVGEQYIDTTGGPQGIIDNYYTSENDLIFNINNNKIYRVRGVDENKINVEEKQTIENPTSTTYIYSQNGQTYGKETLYFDEEWKSSPFILRTANILKNSKKKTYISPYIGLTSDMALKLMNNKVFTMSDSTQSKYLKITGVNKTVWYIDHAPLSAPLESISLTDNTIPYKYEIRSYFRASDENPFVTYEEPYLKLGNTLEGYTNIWTYTSYDVAKENSIEYESYDIYYKPNIVVDNEEFAQIVSAKVFTTHPVSTSPSDEPFTIDGCQLSTGDLVICAYDSKIYQMLYDITEPEITKSRYSLSYLGDNIGVYSTDQYYYITGGTYAGKIIKGGAIVADTESFVVPYLIKSDPLSAITNRYVKLKGFYYQNQQLSWESYRWVLLDHDGNIVQDTGKKYDKTMEVAFYGLSNNSINNQNVYYAILYVEDSVGNKLELSVRLIVDPTSGGNAGIPFNVEYDCQTHSMLLSYQDNAIIYPSFNNSNNKSIDEAYIIQNNIVFTNVLPPDGEKWDNSVNYSFYGEDGMVNITGENGSTAFPIPNIYLGSEGETFPKLSYTEREGLTYAHYFSDNQMSVNANSNLLEVENDEATISTCLAPNGSFSGNLFNINCDSDQDYENIDLQYKIPDSFINFNYYNNSIKNINDTSGFFYLRVKDTLSNVTEQIETYYITYYLGNYQAPSNLRNFSDRVFGVRYICFHLSPGEIIPRSSILKFIDLSPEVGSSYTFKIENPKGRPIFLADNEAQTVEQITSNYKNTHIYANNLNPLRNNLLFTMTCKDTTDMTKTKYSFTGVVKSTSGNWNIFNTGLLPYKYFLQPENKIPSQSNSEYLNFTIEGAHLWYKETNTIGNENKVLNSRLPLGNCALFTLEELPQVLKGSAVYWCEDRGVLKYVTSQSYIDSDNHGINLSISDLNYDNALEKINALAPEWPYFDMSTSGRTLYLSEGEYQSANRDLLLNNDANVIPNAHENSLVVDGQMESEEYWIDNEWIESHGGQQISHSLPCRWEYINGPVGNLTSLGFYSIENWVFKERLEDIYSEETLNKFILTTRYPSIVQIYDNVTDESFAVTSNYNNDATEVQIQDIGTIFTIETQYIEGGDV